MDKKIKIIIIAVVLIVVIALIVNGVSKKKENTNNGEETSNNVGVTYEQDKETGEYIIYNKQTGEEITRVKDEAEIKIYEDNPDYDPKLPTDDLDKDWARIEEDIEIDR